MTSLPPALRGPTETSVGRRPVAPAVSPDGRPDSSGGEIEPVSDALAARVGERLAGLHPVVATLVLVLAAYAVLTAVTVAVGLVLGSSYLGSVDRWDESVNRWFVERRTSLGDGWSAFGSALANTPTVVAIAGVVVLGFAAARRWMGAVLLVVALSLEVTGFLTTTLLVDRERPEVPRLDEAPPTSSFPSGHTAAAVALYVGLALLGSRALRRRTARVAVLVVAALVPVGVGVARLYRGMHHPSDVIGGLALGVGCLVLALLIVSAVGFVVRHRGEAPA